MSSSTPKDRKKIYNALMVVAIVLIAAGAVLGVGALQGWFDEPVEREQAEYPAVHVIAQNKVGNVNIERAGIAYALEDGDRLRDGDIVETLTGSSVDLCYGDVVEQIPEKCEVGIHIDDDNKVSVEYLNSPTEEGEEGTEGDAQAENASVNGVELGAAEASGFGGSASHGSGQRVPVSTCTITINCSKILENLGNLREGKDRFVPANGMMLATSTVAFQEGDTVFDVLKRACAAAGLPLEYSWTPIYDSYYVEGIGNLYEFDCGNESGWMYQVNGWYPNYGCSSYQLNNGDSIVWNYTCNGYGADLGAPMN